MKYRIKQEKGATMAALVVTVIILLIITNILIYNAQDNIYIKKLTNLYNDISILREKVSAYYNEYGKIPAEIKYTNISRLSSVLSTQNDTGDFYVIDLEAMQGITLNYGKDYEKVKKDKENANNYTDLYIINENSHNIFYVKGIEIKENDTTKTYYTDYIEPDQTVIDLRYVDGILIPEGYYYIGKTIDNSGNESIVISTIQGETIDTSKTNQYIWTKQISKLEKIPDSVTLEDNQEEYQFIESVNTYKGYFKNVEGKVQYIVIDEEKWSEAYTKETEYEDKNGDKVMIPEGFKVSMSPTMNIIENGLVIRDENENEYVWVEVPKDITEKCENENEIEEALIEYVSDYRKEGYSDTWYSGCGLTENEYNELKIKMLNSIKDKGGFYIGRYETGTTEERTSESNSSATPYIKRNLFPYNYVTIEQAQELASRLSTQNYSASVIFGIQWDLTCKYLENKGITNNGEKLTPSMINDDSSDWGNYPTSEIIINNKNAKYNINITAYEGWKEVTSQFIKESNIPAMLSTGASDRNKVQNIYDLSGNEYEWTLENRNNVNAVYRGGYFWTGSDNGPVTYRFYHTVNEKFGAGCFRIVIY